MANFRLKFPSSGYRTASLLHATKMSSKFLLANFVTIFENFAQLGNEQMAEVLKSWLYKFTFKVICNYFWKSTQSFTLLKTLRFHSLRLLLVCVNALLSKAAGHRKAAGCSLFRGLKKAKGGCVPSMLGTLISIFQRDMFSYREL